MLDIKKIARKLSPGPERGLFKRIEGNTCLRYETLIAWKNRDLSTLSYPVLLLWAILDVLADKGIAQEVLSIARNRIKMGR